MTMFKGRTGVILPAEVENVVVVNYRKGEAVLGSALRK
jgi:hypothetical protein